MCQRRRSCSWWFRDRTMSWSGITDIDCCYTMRNGTCLIQTPPLELSSQANLRYPHTQVINDPRSVNQYSDTEWARKRSSAVASLHRKADGLNKLSLTGSGNHCGYRNTCKAWGLSWLRLLSGKSHPKRTAPFSVLGSWTAWKGQRWQRTSFCPSLLPECMLILSVASSPYRENCSVMMDYTSTKINSFSLKCFG